MAATRGAWSSRSNGLRSPMPFSASAMRSTVSPVIVASGFAGRSRFGVRLAVSLRPQACRSLPCSGPPKAGTCFRSFPPFRSPTLSPGYCRGASDDGRDAEPGQRLNCFGQLRSARTVADQRDTYQRFATRMRRRPTSSAPSQTLRRTRASPFLFSPFALSEKTRDVLGWGR